MVTQSQTKNSTPSNQQSTKTDMPFTYVIKSFDIHSCNVSFPEDISAIGILEIAHTEHHPELLNAVIPCFV